MSRAERLSSDQDQILRYELMRIAAAEQPLSVRAPGQRPGLYAWSKTQ